MGVTTRRATIAGLSSAALIGLRPARAQGMPVRIGELNSYARMAAFTGPYRNAIQLAAEQVNRAGGVLSGRPLEFVFRDDGSAPGDAVRVAEDLLTRENVAFIAGTFLSNVGLAVSDLANQRKRLFFATEPLTDAITMAQGKTQRRWAIVAPNYEYGQAAAASFKRLITASIPNAEIVAEQYPALGRVDAGATVGAIAQARPDAIFNVLFGPDLTAFVREGNTRGLFERRLVLSLLTGEPEYMIPLGDEAPEGWIVTGYPWEQVEWPAHRAFVQAYRTRFNETPRTGSLLGFVTVQILANLINKANTIDNEALIDALADLKSDTIIGDVTMRGLDHQGTMGAWVGETTLRGNQGAMKNIRYVDGASVMFPEAEVRAARPSS